MERLRRFHYGMVASIIALIDHCSGQACPQCVLPFRRVMFHSGLMNAATDGDSLFSLDQPSVRRT